MRYVELMESKPRWRHAKVGTTIDLIGGRRWYGQVIPLADGTFQYRGWKTNGKAATEQEAKQAIEAIAAQHVREDVVPFPGNPRPVDDLTRSRGSTVLDFDAYRNKNRMVTTHGHGGYWTVRVAGRPVVTKHGRPRQFPSHAAARLAGWRFALGGPGLLVEP